MHYLQSSATRIALGTRRTLVDQEASIITSPGLSSCLVSTPPFPACMEYTKGPTIGLQKSSADLLSAYGFVNSSSTLKEAQKNAQEDFLLR